MKKKIAEAALVFISQGSTAILSLVLFLYISNKLTQSDYGSLALYLTLLTLLQQIIFSPISNSLSRYFPICRESGRLFLLRGIIRKLLFISLMASVFLACSVFYGLQNLSLALMIVYGTLFCLSTILDSILNTSRLRMAYLCCASLHFLSRLIFVYIIHQIYGPSLESTLLGLVIGSCISFFVSFLNTQVPLASLPSGDSQGNLLNELLVYGLPFSVWGIFSFLQQSADKWSLFLFSSREEVGIYAIYFQLGYSTFLLFSSALNQLLLPILFQHMSSVESDNKDKVVKRNTYQINAIYFTTAIGVIISSLFHAHIAKLLLPAIYWSNSQLLTGMILAGGLYSAAQAWANVPLLFCDSKVLLKSRIGISLVGVLIYLVSAKLMNSSGVVIGQVMFAIIALIWTKAVAQKFKKKSNLVAI